MRCFFHLLKVLPKTVVQGVWVSLKVSRFQPQQHRCSEGEADIPLRAACLRARPRACPGREESVGEFGPTAAEGEARRTSPQPLRGRHDARCL